MKIRKFVKEDIQLATNIMNKIYSKEIAQKFSENVKDAFREIAYKPTFLAVEEESKLVGFGGYAQSWIYDSVYEMFWVTIDKEFQGKGFGKTLVNEIVNEIKSKEGSDTAKMIIATTDKPEYYKRYINIKELDKIPDSEYILISLEL